MQSSQTQRRTLLITGANKGIGFGIVDKLFSETTPYDIILTSRDIKLGEAAIEKLKAKHTKSNSTVTYFRLDVNDNQTVENLVKWLKETNRKIDVLVNNATPQFSTIRLLMISRNILFKPTFSVLLTSLKS